MALDFEDYNRSFEEVVEVFEEEADSKLRLIRQQCITDFIENLNKRSRDWDATFHDILRRSQQETYKDPSSQSNTNSSSLKPSSFSLSATTRHVELITPVNLTKENVAPSSQSTLLKQPELRPPVAETPKPKPVESVPEKPKPAPQHTKPVIPKKAEDDDGDQFNDPNFGNTVAIKEFIRIQEYLKQCRQVCEDLSTNQAHKAFKSHLNLFIRTQINSISNSDSQLLDTKTRLLTNLFMGQRVSFQDRLVDATQHPQGQLFSMDLAAQTFVIVGTRLVNSVPVVAESMATVINGIANNNLPMFKDLVTGHLQERCPYLIPMHPKIENFTGNEKEKEIRYRAACGYAYDLKTQTLESEEKYLSRMQSMVLIYANILTQGHMGQAWLWLASFLSLKPQPLISATILQAFLQEASKKMSLTYGRQYRKLVAFMKTHYLKLVEEATPQESNRKPLVKLKNLLSDDNNLFAAPKIGSIFGAIRMG